MSAEIVVFPGEEPHADAVHAVARHLFNCAGQGAKRPLASLISAAAGRLASVDLPFACTVLENTLAALKRGGEAA